MRLSRKGIYFCFAQKQMRKKEGLFSDGCGAPDQHRARININTDSRPLTTKGPERERERLNR